MIVAVTAPPPGSSRLADLVESAGHAGRLLPTVRVVPADTMVLADARAAAGEADVVLLTSARTVDLVWNGTGMAGLSVLAVGSATAAAAAMAGAEVTATGTAGAEALAAEVGPLRPGTVVAFPHAEGTDLEALAALGDIDLRPTVVYRSQPVAPADDPVDAALFASPSAVRGWCISRSFDGLVVAAIGPTTAAAITTAGARPIVAARPSFDALVATLPPGGS